MGIWLIVVGALVSIVGVLKDNSPQPGERSVFGLSLAGISLLILAMAGFTLGVAKEIYDSRESARKQSDLQFERDTARGERDELKGILNAAEDQRSDLQQGSNELKAELRASQREITRLRTQITAAIEASTVGILREIDHPVVSSSSDKIRVRSQAKRGPLMVQPGDLIEYYIFEKTPTLRGLGPLFISTGAARYPMEIDSSRRGSVRIVGQEGRALPITIVNPSKMRIGIKMTVKSSYNPEIIPLIKQALRTNGDD